MPLPLQKEASVAVMPNTLYAPKIDIQSHIFNGRLITSVVIALKPCVCDERSGEWSEIFGETKTIVIPDIENLPEDLVSLAASVGGMYMSIVQLIAQMNAIRKVL